MNEIDKGPSEFMDPFVLQRELMTSECNWDGGTGIQSHSAHWQLKGTEFIVNGEY